MSKPKIELDPTKKIKCPECGSFEVLVGNKEDPLHCSDCEHEWKEDHGCTHESKVIMIKSPAVLLTINQKFKSNVTNESFEHKLDRVLNNK